MTGNDKGPAGGGGTPRVYTIPPGAPFLETLARSILNGDLPVPGTKPPGPLELPHSTLLLPTRRAVRSMREAFLDAADGAAMLLPEIRPIGDVDEDAALLATPAETPGSALALDLPPAVGAAERRLALTKLVLKWSDATGGAYPAITPGQAVHWAADLVALMDSAETEGVDLAALEGLVGGDFAAHWQLTLDFLQILTAHWPAHLAERGLLSPYKRRDELMRAETDRLRAASPAAPVIAAGSTGTVPATAELLETIARLPMGAVVLPGLDLALDEESWGAITAAPGHPEHPQYGMKLLLDAMGVTRADVALLGESEAGSRARLVSEVMRPAGTTQKWREATGGAVTKADVAGITRIDAATEQDEAEVVALILRSVAEQAPRTAALVTPDRMLARRVSTRLEKWGLTVDDSAGRPLAQTPPGTFMDLIVDAARTRFAAVPLMALLKHPLTRLGREPGAIRAAARALELLALRRPFVGHGLSALRDSLEQTVKAREAGELRHPVYGRLGKRDWHAAETLVGELKAAFAPLERLFRNDDQASVRDFADAHVAVGKVLAADEQGSSAALWRGEDGEALSLFFAELLAPGDGGPAIAAADYPEIHRALVAGHAVRPRTPAHPRLFIWGPLEARLQRPDVVIVGGLNEETWPAVAQAGPWLSRPMLAEIGLPSPERRIGLAAHDVAQLVASGEVYLTRAEKADGAPTVPSRWLLRLDAILKAAGLDKEISNDDWAGWAAKRDDVEPSSPISPPAPRPRVEARPKRLSVTRIEHWIANPYAIFAHDILRLRKLDPLIAVADTRLRGTLVHDALSAFARRRPERLPQKIADELMGFFRSELEKLGADPAARAFWRPQLANFAEWFAATEPGRREGVARVHSEIDGALALPGVDFTLTARADRIDVLKEGALAIYDYKTGAAPNPTRVAKLTAPQLPLEAAIAAASDFDGVPRGETARLCYIRVVGRGAGGEESDVGGGDPATLAQEALDRLAGLVAAYADPETPYEAKRRPGFAGSNQYRYDDYEHLARLAEWQGAGGEEG